MLLLYTSIESDDVSAVHSKIWRKKIFVVLDLYNQAEVQSVFADGSLSLHTRSLKYGKVGINYWEFSIIMYLTHKNCTLRYSFSKVYIFLHIPVHVFHKFSQLGQGTLVQVSPSLIKRRKTHFHHLPCGATIILGNNGYVWICPTETEEMDQTGGYELNWKVTNVETSSMYLSGFYFSLQIYFLSLINSLVYHTQFNFPAI